MPSLAGQKCKRVQSPRGWDVLHLGLAENGISPCRQKLAKVHDMRRVPECGRGLWGIKERCDLHLETLFIQPPNNSLENSDSTDTQSKSHLG